MAEDENSIEAALRDVLKNHSRIQALGIQDRIFPEVLPQGQELPAVTYEVFSDVPYDDISGNASLYRAIIEYTIYSENRTETTDIENKIRLTLQGYQGVNLDVKIRGIYHLDGKSGYKGEIRNHVRMVSFSATYRRENVDHDDS